MYYGVVITSILEEKDTELVFVLQGHFTEEYFIKEGYGTLLRNYLIRFAGYDDTYF